MSKRVSNLSRSPERRVRVPAVDDSVVILRLMTPAIETEPGKELVGSVVQGMPDLVAKAGLTDAVLPPELVVPQMIRRAEPARQESGQ